MIRQYPALLRKENHNGYAVVFPDFPSCVSSGTTPEEAHRTGQEALQHYVDGMRGNGGRLPEPTDLGSVCALASREGETVVALATVRLPGRIRRINITIDEHLLDAIDSAASARGMNRSAFLAEGARRLMNGS